MVVWKCGRTEEWQRMSTQSGGEETDIDKSKCSQAFLQTPALDKPVIKVWLTGTSAAG